MCLKEEVCTTPGATAVIRVTKICLNHLTVKLLNCYDVSQTMLGGGDKRKMEEIWFLVN